MTTDATPAKSSISRKIWWLGIAIVLVIAAYTAAWFYAANRMQQGLSMFLEEGKASGVSGECVNSDVRGYPFRIGYYCDSVKIDDSQMAASATFGALRTAAQVYQPGHYVLELDGPMEMRAAPGMSVTANWNLLHSSVVNTRSGIERTSMTYDKLTGKAITPELPGTLSFAASHGEIHLRQNGPDLDAALSGDALTFSVEGLAGFPRPLDSRIDLTLYDQADLLARNAPKTGIRNSRGELRSASLDLGDGMIVDLSGPFSVNAEGLISGEINVSLKNISAWEQTLSVSFPEASDMIGNVAKMLKALSNGGNDASVKLNLRDGMAFLAFIPLGELPRL